MKLKKQKNSILIILLSFIFTFNVFLPMTVKANANEEIFEIPHEKNMGISTRDADYVPSITTQDICEKEYFIKNAQTGQYLDVAGGVAASGTNVQQYKYNGTDSQRWMIHLNSDNTYSLFTRLGAAATKTYLYALDISNASGDNYANVQIYDYNGSDAQKFNLSFDRNFRFMLFTKVTNYSKAIVVNGPTYDEGRNVDQYTYQGYQNEKWILEPVKTNYIMGQQYAKANAMASNGTNKAYPNLIPREVDCTNFVSQCMLASGVHYTDGWKIYRKNDTYDTPYNNYQFDYSFEHTKSWSSADLWGDYWKPRSGFYIARGSSILELPAVAMFDDIGIGDVIQVAENENGKVGTSIHSVYITGIDTKNGHTNYLVSSHTDNYRDNHLLDVVSRNSDKFFIFYKTI